MFRSRNNARCQQTAKHGVLNQIAFPSPRQVNSGFAKQIHNVSLTQPCPLPTNCETWCSESDCRCRLSAYSSPFFFPHPSFSSAARKIHLPPREGISRIRLPSRFRVKRTADQRSKSKINSILRILPTPQSYSLRSSDSSPCLRGAARPMPPLAKGRWHERQMPRVTEGSNKRNGLGEKRRKDFLREHPSPRSGATPQSYFLRSSDSSPCLREPRTPFLPLPKGA